MDNILNVFWWIVGFVVGLPLAIGSLIGTFLFVRWGANVWRKVPRVVSTTPPATIPTPPTPTAPSVPPPPTPTNLPAKERRSIAKQTDDCSYQCLFMVRTRGPASSHKGAGRSQTPTTQIHQVNSSNLCISGPFAPPTSPNP